MAESYKTYMGSIALTAPDSMGFLAGSTLYAGFVNGFSDHADDPRLAQAAKPAIMPGHGRHPDQRAAIGRGF